MPRHIHDLQRGIGIGIRNDDATIVDEGKRRVIVAVSVPADGKHEAETGKSVSSRMAINVTRTSSCHGVTTLHHRAWAVGLSYHGSLIIHSRIENAVIQAFRIENLEERVLLFILPSIHKTIITNYNSTIYNEIQNRIFSTNFHVTSKWPKCAI